MCVQVEAPGKSMPQADNEQIADCRQGTAQRTAQTKQLQLEEEEEEEEKGGENTAGRAWGCGGQARSAPEINGQQCELCEKFLQSQIEISHALLCIQSCHK